MPFPNIPVDLFECILDHLTPSDLVALTQVSKLFNAFIVPRLYFHTVLKIDSLEHKSVKEDQPNYEVWLEALRGLVSNSQKQCESVHKLTICGEYAFGENKSKHGIDRTIVSSRSQNIQGAVSSLVNFLLEMALPKMAQLIDIEWLSGFRPSNRIFEELSLCPLRSLSFNAGLMVNYHVQENMFRYASLNLQRLDWDGIESLRLFNLNDLESIGFIARVIRHAGGQLKDLQFHFSLPFPRDKEQDIPPLDATAWLLGELGQAPQPRQLQALGIYESGKVDLTFLFHIFDVSVLEHFTFMPHWGDFSETSAVWSELHKREVKLKSVMADHQGEGMEAYFSSFEGLRELFLQYVETNLAVSPLCARHWSTLRTIFLPHNQHAMEDLGAIIQNCTGLKELGMMLYTSSIHAIYKLFEQSRLQSVFFYTSSPDPNPNRPVHNAEIMSPKNFIKRFVEYFAGSPRRQRPQNFSTFYHGLKRISYHDSLWVMTPTSEVFIEGSTYDYIARGNHPKRVKIHDTGMIATVREVNQFVLNEFREKGVRLLPVRVQWSKYRGDKTVERLIDYLITKHPERTAHPYAQANRFVEPRLRY
ncbi:hypothetical protein D8B26_005720 [Coccidioides posadasii str. Silveira]|nr:hypothetical protein CPAG_03249 [Coccidioides posadasii RMSCC 3488]QVM11068.1 hypothetical protein D8B26_005720 [Coccidioides posadasii str. Silveira]